MHLLHSLNTGSAAIIRPSERSRSSGLIPFILFMCIVLCPYQPRLVMSPAFGFGFITDRSKPISQMVSGGMEEAVAPEGIIGVPATTADQVTGVPDPIEEDERTMPDKGTEDFPPQDVAMGQAQSLSLSDLAERLALT